MPKDEIKIFFVASSLDDLKQFPDVAVKDAGYQLGLLQMGEEPTDWKAFPSVGSGVREIRVSKGGAFRVMYVTKFNDSIYVLHAFQKKTQKTRKSDIDLAKARYRDLLNELGGNS